MNTADHAMVEKMRVRLVSTLRKLKGQGKVAAEKQKGETRVGRWCEHYRARGCRPDRLCVPRDVQSYRATRSFIGK